MLSRKQKENICKAKCEKHGVNFNFFFTKLIPLRFQTVADVIEYLDEEMYNEFFANHENMYEGITTEDII